MTGPIDSAKFLAGVAVALLKRPSLIPSALQQARSLAPQRWWSSGSRLPMPRADYLEFRNTTLSGNPDKMATPHDVIVYLEWCRSMRALPGRG